MAARECLIPSCPSRSSCRQPGVRILGHAPAFGVRPVYRRFAWRRRWLGLGDVAAQCRPESGAQAPHSRRFAPSYDMPQGSPLREASAAAGYRHLLATIPVAA